MDMSVIHHWKSGTDCLPSHRIVLAALPGVGNVGKLIVDSLIEAGQAEMVLQLLHPAMPPQARLDEDGLLTPPGIMFHHFDDIIIVTADGQPMTPEGQHECAIEILRLAREADSEHVVVLAGMAAAAGEEEAFMVCSDTAARLELEGRGADIRRDQPNGGVIGMVGLLASLGPAIGVKSSCAIATTVGASVDPVASDRLLRAVCDWFSLDISPPGAILERMAVNMTMLEGKGTAGEVPDPLLADSSPMLYS